MIESSQSTSSLSPLTCHRDRKEGSAVNDDARDDEISQTPTDSSRVVH
jgi:hypothetical protein